VRSPAAIGLLRDLLAPPRCGTCSAPCEAAEIICRPCSRDLACARGGSTSLPGICRVTWTAPYEGTARALVVALKFRGAVSLARVAGGAVVSSLPAELDGWRVVAVPAAPFRHRRRGYDPAELIAVEVSSQLGLAIDAPLRRADNRRQVGRPRRERVASPPRIGARCSAPPRTLLVDDVLTTGATLSACATALRAAGSTEVRASVFAHALGDTGAGA